MVVDTVAASALWGRIGASILMFASVALSYFGYEFAAEDQTALFKAISALLGAVGGLLAIISKVRETKRLAASQ